MKTLAILCLLIQSAEIFPVTAKEEPVKQLPIYVVAFHMRGCQPCNRWEQNEQAKLESAGVQVVRVNSQIETQWGIGLNPSFWICRDKVALKKFKQGEYKTAKELLKEIETLSAEPVKSSGVPKLFGRIGTSQESRQTLVNHLLNDSIHKGRHTSAELEAMTDQQLSDLHDREHNTASGTSSTTHWTVQPRRVQTVRRRRGLFFQW